MPPFLRRRLALALPLTLPLTLPLALPVTLTLATLASPVPAHAQMQAPMPGSEGDATAADGPRAFDLAPRPLAQALNDWALQAGRQLIVEPALVNQRMAPAVSGQFTPREALDRLLAGSGLVARTDGAAVIIEAARPSPPPPPSGTRPDAALAPVTVMAAAERAATTEGSGAYAPQAVTVGKTVQSLREIPQSISVVSRQQIEDQGLTSLSDVLRRTPGVTQADGIYRSSFTARGMSISNLRFEGGGASRFHSGEIDTAIYDHVAVVRGADGLFGAGDAGGVINLKLKRPTEEGQVGLALTGGSWKLARAEIDASGPLTEGGSVRGRFIAVRQDRNRFYRPGEQDHSLVYGAVEADLTPRTVLFVAAYNQVSNQIGLNNGSPRFADGRDLQLPRSLGLGLPWANTRRETTEGFAQLAHQLAGEWKIQANLRAIYEMQHWRYAALSSAIDPTTQLATWSTMPEDSADHDLNFDLNLTGSFAALGRRHDVLVGFDAGRRSGFSGWGSWDFGDLRQTDIFNPVRPPEGGVRLTTWSMGQSRDDSRSLYGSLRLRPLADLSLVAGGRYLIRDKTINYDENGQMTGLREEGRQLIPYFGVIYDLSSTLSAYASTTEIYQSQATRLAGPPPGRPLDPTTGRNYEIGIKGEWNRRLVASAALYRVEKKGEAYADPAWPDTLDRGLGSSCCFIGDGNLLSQGVDLELSGEVGRGWQVSVGYTYNSNHNRREDDERFSAQTPRHLFKAWTEYAFDGRASGLKIGGGVLAQSSNFRAGSVNALDPETGRHTGPAMDYRFTQPGYAVWFMNAEYAISRQWGLQLNLNNLFDKAYYNTVGGTWSGNYYGEPRSAYLTLRARF